MGNEVGLITMTISMVAKEDLEFPSPMGNEVGLIKVKSRSFGEKLSFRPLWGMR